MNIKKPTLPERIKKLTPSIIGFIIIYLIIGIYVMTYKNNDIQVMGVPYKNIEADDLFYTFKKTDNCYVSQKEDIHYLSNNGGVLATDVACGFQAEVHAPDFKDKQRVYTLTSGHDELLGDYVKLLWKEESVEYMWIIGHVQTRLPNGSFVKTGQRIGQTNLSGATTGHHSHIELLVNINGEWTHTSYTTRSKVVLNQREDTYENDGLGAKIYLTSYDLGDVTQNDDSPCIGASGVNLCQLSEKGVQTIALTVDIRKLYGIKFGDNITLEDSLGYQYTVQVHDEMNRRYRRTCIRGEGFCKKGDIARYGGVPINGMKSGVYKIIK